MNKTVIAKAVVNNLTGYAVGTATAMFLTAHRKHSDNVVIETLLNVSTIVATVAVGGLVQKHLAEYTNAEIDKIVDAFNESKKSIKAAK